jgi:hypothetical protein
MREEDKMYIFGESRAPDDLRSKNPYQTLETNRPLRRSVEGETGAADGL